jgi:hypothetical protein
MNRVAKAFRWRADIVTMEIATMTHKRDTYQPTQTWKQSRPVKLDGVWRILNHAGQIVGAYETKKLAQRAIDKAPYLQ